MILSHKHKFIFIKTRKTAGTSIEIALSKLCGPDDIITPITKKDEEARQALGFRGPQNYKIPVAKWLVMDWKKYIMGKGAPQFYNHMPAKEVMNYIDPTIWKEYFTFSFERNPWDKAISFYYFKNKNKANPPSQTDFILGDVLPEVSSYDQYTIDNQVIVDKMYAFESIPEALLDISQHLNLKEPLQMPNYRAKSHTRKDKRPYQEVLNEKEARRVEALFKREIALMGYKF